MKMMRATFASSSLAFSWRASALCTFGKTGTGGGVGRDIKLFKLGFGATPELAPTRSVDLLRDCCDTDLLRARDVVEIVRLRARDSSSGSDSAARTSAAAADWRLSTEED